MVFNFSYHFIPLLFSIAFSFGLIIYLFKFRKSPVIRALLVILSGAFVWSTGHLFEYGCTNLTSKLFWINVVYVGIVAVPVGWLILALLYQGKRHWVTTRNIIIVSVIPFLTIIFNMTNHLHGLMRYNIGIDTAGSFSVITRTPGVWFWINMVYCNLLMLAGSIVIIKRLLTPPKAQTRQLLLVFAAVATPWAGTLIHTFNLFPEMRIDPSSSLIPVSIALIVSALYPFNVFDVIPIARDYILENLSEGIVVTDTLNRIIDHNPSFKIMTGRKNIKFGEELKEVFENVSLPEIMLSRQELVRRELVFRSSGVSKAYEVQMTPVFSKNLNFIGRIFLFKDITENKKIMETALQTQKLDSLGTLAGGIAHEFNNILNAVFGYIELAENASENEKVQNYLAKALLGFDRASELAEQLLTFSKGGALIYKKMSLFPYLKERITIISKQTRVNTLFNIADDLYECRIDKNQIGQAVDSIIINGAEAMGNKGEIKISAQNTELTEGSEHLDISPGKYVKISISDTGTGISKEILPRIFDPFFSTKEKGTGLGLSASHSIVKQHSGTIDIETQPGKGTTFHIYLPAAQ